MSNHSPVEPTTAPRIPAGKSKAEILREYRLKTGVLLQFTFQYHYSVFTGRPHLPEQLLLRDALYLLQGISGKYVHFSLHDDAENTLVFIDDSVSKMEFAAS